MKPSWDEAPSWAQWLAMDNDGYWLWYENKPCWKHSLGEWERRNYAGHHAIAQRPPEPRFEGEETLEKRPCSQPPSP